MRQLRLTMTDSIARLLIDHPERRNALNREMWRTIPNLIQEVSTHKQIRVLALQSAEPGMFTAGADISEFEKTYANATEASIANDEIQTAVDAIASCPLPVVALIDGPCIGGGIALAIACDFILASPRSTFAVTPAKLGLSYHPTNIRRLVRACGLGATCELLYTAQVWDASRALQTGLINQLIPITDFARETDSLLTSITDNSPKAIQTIKKCLQVVVNNNIDDMRDMHKEFYEHFSSPDFIEGRNAFLEKRRPIFPSYIS